MVTTDNADYVNQGGVTMATFTVHVGADESWSENSTTFQVDDSELEGLDPNDRDDFLRDAAREHKDDLFTWWVTEGADNE